MSGKYAGAITRLIAFLFDWLLATFIFGFIATGIAFFINLFFDVQVEIDRSRPWIWFTLAGFWAFLYFAGSLAVAGRTPGKAVVGLRVVERDGSPLKTRAAVVRTVVFPFSCLLFGLGFVGILLGKERRALHDVAAGSVVVYDWGDRAATMPDPLADWLARRGAAPE